MNNLKEILQRFSEKKILVIGDIMLDHYIWGKVDRISPEAPVPVLDVEKEEYRLGGAANVALNLKALGAEVFLCGIIGDDEAGKTIRELLTGKGIETGAIVTDKHRASTRKTRIGADTQQIVRIDYENRVDISEQIAGLLLNQIEVLMPHIDAVIMEDYNKGLLTSHLIEKTITLAKQQNKPVTVDPKQKNFFQYHGVSVFKPNYAEMQKNLGIIFETEADFTQQAWSLKRRIECENLVITRGEKGLFVFSNDSIMHHIPTFAREVYDVSGAGDTVISALTLALCSGCDIESAAVIANHAAGVVCGKMGTATVSIREIESSYYDHR